VDVGNGGGEYLNIVSVYIGVQGGVVQVFGARGISRTALPRLPDKCICVCGTGVCGFTYMCGMGSGAVGEVQRGGKEGDRQRFGEALCDRELTTA
jgi:hypothetical protein